jgi:RNA polymerase sigma-70 factor (ECF subfamily)
MMFVCCHPSIPEESQVAMILKTLCGFSVAEIASVYFTNEETVTKRLYRAREQFRKEKIDFRIPETEELPDRLTGVLTSVYILFTQGYHASHHESLVRAELIEESLRLCKMITDNPTTRVPESLALLALICFHAARITSRIDEHGNFISLRFQDRSQWNTELINKGSQLLREASRGTFISVYHIQAAIAYEHCLAKSYQQTNWKQILAHYDLWYQLQPFAVIALNRAIVLAEAEGPAAALAILDQLQPDHTVKNYYLLASAKAEFYHQLKRYAEAKTYYEKAMTQTTSPTERKYLQEKIDRLSH